MMRLCTNAHEMNIVHTTKVANHWVISLGNIHKINLIYKVAYSGAKLFQLFTRVISRQNIW